MKLPFGLQVGRPASPRLSVADSELRNKEYVQRRIAELTGGRPGSTPLEWRLAWLAAGSVLKRRGIHPRFSGPRATEALESWMMYKPDPAGKMKVRDMLRVVLVELMWRGEAFVELSEGGKFMPQPPPSDIVYDPETRLPTKYVWTSYREFRGMTLLPEQVMHIYIEMYAGQRRGQRLYRIVSDIAVERHSYIRSAVRLAKLASRFWAFHKPKMGRPTVDDDTNSAKKNEITIDMDEDEIFEIGPEDDILFPRVGAQPIPPNELDRVVGTTLAMPYGISRMSVLGDSDDANYSSARFAYLGDQRTWAVYSEKILDFVRELYREWPERPLYDPFRVGWYVPPPEHIDPTKTASANRILVEIGAKAVQEVILEDDRDPETTFRLIEEHRRRMRPSEETGPGGNDG